MMVGRARLNELAKLGKAPYLARKKAEREARPPKPKGLTPKQKQLQRQAECAARMDAEDAARRDEKRARREARRAQASAE
jgi:hypothetical protein